MHQDSVHCTRLSPNLLGHCREETSTALPMAETEYDVLHLLTANLNDFDEFQDAVWNLLCFQ
eukprot:706679-Amphidinium_carterae.1